MLRKNKLSMATEQRPLKETDPDSPSQHVSVRLEVSLSALNQCPLLSLQG